MAADLQLITDFLVGRDEVTRKLGEYEAMLNKFGRVFQRPLFEDLTKFDKTLPPMRNLNQELEGVVNKSAIFRKNLDLVGRSFSQYDGVLRQMEMAGRMSAQGMDVSEQVVSLRQLGKQAGVTGEALTNSFDKGRISAQKFDMSLLSVMFTSMIVSNTIWGMNRAMISTYMKAEEDTSGLHDATNRLGASWEFFKFSMIDALNTPVFIGFIDGIITIIDALSDMKEWVKVAILSGTTGLGVLAIGGTLYSQIVLFTDAVFASGGLLNQGAKDSADAITGIGASAEGLKTHPGMVWLKGLAATGIGIGAFMTLDDFFTGKDNLSDTVDEMGTWIAGLGAISGKKWVLALGIALKILPFGEQIENWGYRVQEAAKQKLVDTWESADEAQGNPKKAAATTTQLIGGVASLFVGGTATGAGFLLRSTEDWISGLDEADTTMATTAETIETRFIPGLETSSENMSKLRDAGTELMSRMDEWASETTTKKIKIELEGPEEAMSYLGQISSTNVDLG